MDLIQILHDLADGKRGQALHDAIDELAKAVLDARTPAEPPATPSGT